MAIEWKGFSQPETGFKPKSAGEDVAKMNSGVADLKGAVNRAGEASTKEGLAQDNWVLRLMRYDDTLIPDAWNGLVSMCSKEKPTLATKVKESR